MSLFNLFKRVQPEKQKPDLDSTFFSMKIKQLPANFAQTVMELQMKLQFAESYDLETVQQLNDLFKLAVEYYIHEDPKKAKHFQRKLTSLLSNPQTLTVIESSTLNSPRGRDQEYQRTLKNELGSFNSQSHVVVEQIIQGSCRRAEKNGRLLNEQINGQEERLRERLEKRSKSKNRRPFLSP